MAKQLSVAFVKSFDAQVKQAYQGVGKLRPIIRVKTGVVGSTHQFPRIGKGLATLRVPQQDVTPMNIVPVVRVATLKDYNAAEYTDIFDQQKVNFEEQQALAFVIASAIGRREDQEILDQIDAASTSLTVATGVGGTATNLNTAKFRDASKQLTAGGVPMGDRHAIIHANNLFGLLGDTTATSADFNTIRALVDGQINAWVGFKVTTLEDRDEGGIPLPSTRTTYFLHGGMMGSMGLAVGIDFRTEVNYIPEKTSWLANGLWSAGAVDIDVNGIVEVACTE